MSTNPPLYVIAWLYIDGNIIQNGVDGYSYDCQMSRLIKLDVSLNYKQLCDVMYTKLNIDTNLYELKIMHRCFNPITKMFGVAPILDDDDVELMFELVLSLGVKNCVVELYVERVLVDGFVEKSVDVAVALNSSSGRTGLLFDLDVGVSRDSGKGGEIVEVGRDFGEIGEDVEVGLDFGEIGEDVEAIRDLGKRSENVEVSGDVGKRGENAEVIGDVESGGSNKKTLYMQRVDTQGKRILRGRNKGGDSGIPLYSSFDGSFMVASLKEPVFTNIGDVFHVTDLRKGMVFVSREELAHVVFHVHHRNHQEVKVTRANSLNWTVECKRKASGCIWRLKARKRKQHGFFEIMLIWGSHTCVNLTITQDPANLISNSPCCNLISNSPCAAAEPCCSNIEVPNTQVVDPFTS